MEVKVKTLQEDFRVIDSCLCIRMPEEVDHHHAEELSRIADHIILEEQVENVLFDFEDTRFMDSSGIGILIGRYRLISCFGGKIYVSHTDRQIRRMMKMSGVQKIVEIVDGAWDVQ